MANVPPRSADDQTDPGSFRDPSGFVFERDGVLYRQVNRSYQRDYDALVASGLARTLIDDGSLIPHQEVDTAPSLPQSAYKVIQPNRVPFLSYPHEWSFSELKAAALLTLDIQRKALDHKMVLKDSSAFNIQFVGCKPVFIDTLSFEVYEEGSPWVAYRQFCRHFLAPLALMSRVDIRLNQLMLAHLDGIPLDLASRLLPGKSRLNLGLLMHLHLHARAERAYSADATPRAAKAAPRFSKQALLGLIDSLKGTVSALSWNPAGTEWADYYDETNYTTGALGRKAELVGSFLDQMRPRSVWDLGANTGRFSRLAAERGASTVAFDIDPACVERNYLDGARRGDQRLLPLLLNVANPSPAFGWDHAERKSLLERGPVDTAMALALIHHLAISGNVPLGRIAAFLRKVCHNLIIEFVPKSDSQVQRLLATRVDVFPDYHIDGFEAAFVEHFAIERAEPILDSQRTLYLMRARPG